jgi:asparagine synthase (glutamine-hydrolysing)
MCGIAGFNWNDTGLIKSMGDSLKHRGPDDEGFFSDSEVSLGHRRLSIIDLSPKGHQPMVFENLVIVFNGEIYNFKHLREQLKTEGYNFLSDTDTEVILYSYHKWGPACVNRFNGMWAFCIYNKSDKTFFISRDRFGIKPLYYYFDGRKFVFASELKAIRKHHSHPDLSVEAANYFFYQKYVGGDLTIFKNCHKLRAGENLLFNLRTKKVTINRYYDINKEVAVFQEVPLSERLRTVENTITEAIEKRLIADVPVGSFLSGGLDSSLISAVINGRHMNFDTFSIGFRDDSYNELEYSKLVAGHLKTRHHFDYMDIDEDSIRFVLDSMDEPFGDASVFPTYLLSKITRQKVTVCLSGDGGDEVFGGYDTYKAYKLARFIPGIAAKLCSCFFNMLPPSDKKVSLSFKVKRFSRDSNSNVNRRHLDWMATFNDSQRRMLVNDLFISAESFMEYSSDRSILSVQLNDIENYLPGDILNKVDFASMLNSLESRVPYLDHELVPMVLSLPEKYKIKGLRTKWLLRNIASKYVPQQIINRPKRGFTVPISRWIKESDLISEVLTSRTYYQHELLNYDYVLDLYNNHINQKQDNARQLWLVFIFNYWWKRNG